MLKIKNKEKNITIVKNEDYNGFYKNKKNNRGKIRYSFKNGGNPVRAFDNDK